MNITQLLLSGGITQVMRSSLRTFFSRKPELRSLDGAFMGFGPCRAMDSGHHVSVWCSSTYSS